MILNLLAHGEYFKVYKYDYDYDYDYEIDLFGHIILRKYITMKCIIYKI